MRISLQNVKVKIRNLTVECGLQMSIPPKTCEVHHKNAVR